MKKTTAKAWLGLSIPILSIPILCLTAPVAASAQTVFASTQSATLPAAAPSDAGEILVEISHRFGHLSDGASDLWGLDGFVLNRLGLAYAPHDHDGRRTTCTRCRALAPLESPDSRRRPRVDRLGGPISTR